MKLAMAIALACAWTCCQNAQGNQVQIARSHWVIIATLIDRTTGERLQQRRLPGSELEFDDAASCKSVVDKVSPVHDDHITVVLTCRKVERPKTTFEHSVMRPGFPSNPQQAT